MQHLIEIGTLLESLHGIKGRKRLQKLVFLIQEFGSFTDFKFGLGKSGLYSRDLSEYIEWTCADGLIDETIQDDSDGGSFFVLSKELHHEIESSREKCSNIKWLDFAKELNSLDTQKLDTMCYIRYLNCEEGGSDEPMSKRVAELAPMTEGIFDDVYERFQDLSSRFSLGSTERASVS